MARSKNAAALFEVIQSSRFPNRPDPLRTPRWWFKRRDSIAEARSTASDEPVAPEPEPAATIAQTAMFAPAAPLAAAPAIFPHVPLTAPEEPSHEPRWATRLPIPGVDLQLDPDSHQVTVKVSYYGAIISAFTVLVVIALAYVVGVKMHHAPIAATSSPSTELLRARPPHPEVLEVANTGSTRTSSAILSHSPDNAVVASSKQPGKPAPGGASPPSPASVDATRVVNRQYVVIQIYRDEKTADDAVALLNKNNIPATIEKGLTGWASPAWYCVVGTTGFDRIRDNSDFEHYESDINRLSQQFAGNSKFKQFEPRAYRWRGAGGTAAQ